MRISTYHKSITKEHNGTILKKNKSTKGNSIFKPHGYITVKHALLSETTNLRASRVYICWQAAFLPSHWLRWHIWTPQLTHSHGQTWSDISHTSFLPYPSILRVCILSRTARTKTLPTLVSFPPTSLTLGSVETRPPHRALNSTLKPAFLSFIPPPSLFSILSTRTWIGFLINHFHLFINFVFYFCGLLFFLQIPGLNLIQSACLAHNGKWVREGRVGGMKYKTLIISCSNATAEWVSVHVHVCQRD